MLVGYLSICLMVVQQKNGGRQAIKKPMAPVGTMGFAFDEQSDYAGIFSSATWSF